MKVPHNSLIPPVAVGNAARSLCYELGVQPAAQRLGVSASTLANVCGLLPVHKANLFLVADRLGIAL